MLTFVGRYNEIMSEILAVGSWPGNPLDLPPSPFDGMGESRAIGVEDILA